MIVEIISKSLSPRELSAQGHPLLQNHNRLSIAILITNVGFKNLKLLFRLSSNASVSSNITSNSSIQPYPNSSYLLHHSSNDARLPFRIGKSHKRDTSSVSDLVLPLQQKDKDSNNEKEKIEKTPSQLIKLRKSPIGRYTEEHNYKMSNMFFSSYSKDGTSGMLTRKPSNLNSVTGEQSNANNNTNTNNFGGIKNKNILKNEADREESSHSSRPASARVSKLSEMLSSMASSAPPSPSAALSRRNSAKSFTEDAPILKRFRRISSSLEEYYLFINKAADIIAFSLIIYTNLSFFVIVYIIAVVIILKFLLFTYRKEYNFIINIIV